MPPLSNHRHEAFAQYYVHGHPPRDNGRQRTWREKRRHNATRSYEAAGYDARDRVATAAAMRLLRRADVRRRIDELEREKARDA